MIHRGYNVGVVVHPGLLILDHPGVIPFFYPMIALAEIVAGAGFIPQGPNDDGRMIFVALYHPADPVLVAIQPVG